MIEQSLRLDKDPNTYTKVNKKKAFFKPLDNFKLGIWSICTASVYLKLRLPIKKA